MDRKSLRRLKGCAKLKVQIHGHSVKDQANRAVSHIHKWSKIQADIGAHQICMITEDRIRRKKLESQLKLEARLHDLEVAFLAPALYGLMACEDFSFYSEGLFVYLYSMFCKFFSYSLQFLI